VVAHLLLEHVPHQLDGVELLLDREVAFREPADRGAEREAGGIDQPVLLEFVQQLEDVRRDLVDVGVVELEHVD